MTTIQDLGWQSVCIKKLVNATVRSNILIPQEFFIPYFSFLFLFFWLFLYFLFLKISWLRLSSFVFWRNLQENPNKISKENMIVINIAHFFNMASFYFIIKSNITLLSISSVIVAGVFQDLEESEIFSVLHIYIYTYIHTYIYIYIYIHIYMYIIYIA